MRVIAILGLCLAMIPSNPPVQTYGALRNMMHSGDISAKVYLNELDHKNLYALGAVADLKGEIIVMDGAISVSSEKLGTVIIDHTYDHAATLLVSSKVSKWDSLPVVGPLEKIIEAAAREHELDTEEPFPFMLKGDFESIQWHVINWPEGETEHTHAKHKTSGPHGELRDAEAEVLGFFSKHHQGIFTHHSTYLHMHFVSKSGELAGHVDHLIPGDETWLYLPQREGD